ncbi:tumor necrosis factor receptor superfamily member 10A-like [Pantherophis guttatus]|uniref:Tumor necrosis factor receptor superfamily member 10A-like n=1 Tax=Pantherophis guttatus TaxID=94885 RepID=A0A6P9BP62_PANGU|nr:tumor necrosis factor receptor superfamily member 10A-like [Pantherophis guttatus]
MAEATVVVMMAWLASLTLLRKVESPPLWADCNSGEFPYSGICCKRCPAGSRVEEFCTVPHTQGKCEHCIDGENYTEHDNGLEHCLPCIDCKPGYKMIAPCTREKNTECQCNDGYFCPQGCEECVKCKIRCPEGQVIMENCSATTDMKCGPPYPEASDSSFVYIVIGGLIALVLLVFFMLICCIIYKRRKSNSAMKKENKESRDHLIPDNNENVNSTTEATAASQDRLPETEERENLEMGRREQDYVLPNTPSVSSSVEVACSNGQSSGRNDVQSSNKPAVRIKTSRKETLEKVYFQTKDIVGSDYWNTFMRKCGLSHNDIQTIKHDYAQHFDEQQYQMLRTLRDRNGVVVAFDKIFASLQEMDLNGIYENLINELKSKDLIIKETED